MRGAKGRIALVGLCVALLVPAGGRAQALELRIDEVAPSRVRAGSGPVEVAVLGDGFVRNERVGPAGAGSWLFVDEQPVETRVLSEDYLEATVPAELLTEPRVRWLTVRTGAGTPDATVTPFVSNAVELEVTPAAAALRVDVYPEQVVRSCFGVWVFAVDASGEQVPGDGISVTLLSDDVDTATPGDGHLTFHADYADYPEPYAHPADGSCGQPLEGALPLGPEGAFLYARGDVPESVVVEARSADPVLFGATERVRLAGGFLEGRVVTDRGRRPVAGVEVWASLAFAEPLPGAPPRAPRGVAPAAAGAAAASIGAGHFGCGPVLFVRGRRVPGLITPPPPTFEGEPVAVTGADGTFRSVALAPGSYLLQFRPPPETFLVAEWFNDAPDPSGADPVSVVDRQVTGDVEAALALGGTISGRVTAEAAGAPLGAWVSVVDRETRGVVTVATTDADGAFRTTGVRAVDYAVLFEPSDDAYLPEWFDGEASLATADPVAVTTGADTGGIAASLLRGAVLTGHAVAADTGERLAASVAVYDEAAGTQRAWGYTEELEDLTFLTRPGLRAGTYRVRIDSVAGPYVGGWYDGAASFATATPLTLAVGEERAIEVRLPRGALFTGTVTAGGEPAPGVLVEVYQAAEERWVASGCSDGEGRYATRGLAAGAYKIRFDPPGNLAPEWFDGKADFASADVLTVALGEERVADAALSPGGRIVGRITEAGGAAVPNANVEIFEAGERYPVAYGYTNEDGSYTVEGLASGPYHVYANPYDDVHPPTWYPDAASRAEAAAVEVSAPGDATADVVLGAAGFLSGRVSTRAGAPVGTYIEIVDAATGEPAGYGFTDLDGTYRSTPLHAGTYKVKFFGTEALAPEWYSDATTVAGAAPLPVAAGATVSGIDAVLEAGSSIGGTVRAAHSGAPVPDVLVRIVDAATGEDLGWGYTDPDGAFRSSALRPGAYKASFEPYEVFAAQWYAGKPTFETADVLEVRKSHDTGGANVLLALAP